MVVSNEFERGTSPSAQTVLDAISAMLSGRLLGLLLAMIGVIVIALTAVVIYLSTASH
jgi:hypothetical protein